MRYAREQIDSPVDVVPCAAADLLNPACLARRKDRETDSEIGEDFQSLGIHRSFRQPHPFRTATEALLEIAYAPEHLCVAIGAIRQRQNHVVVGLRNGIAVSGEALLARAIRVENLPVNAAGVVLPTRRAALDQN